MSGGTVPSSVPERVSWHRARSIAEEIGSPLSDERVSIGQAIGRDLAEDLVTPIDLPHYASAAMDGWLVAGTGPWTIVDSHPQPGQARPAVTGGNIPAGSFAVLRSESAAVESGTVRSIVSHEPREGQHIRASATEARRGETLLPRGHVLNPASVALAASAGYDEVVVRPVPTVGLVFTGDEVVTSGIPSEGLVRDAFGVQLPSLFDLLGARAASTQRIGDDLQATINAIDDNSHSLIVTTGGTGGSSADHVRPALHALGADIVVEGVAMRPGGPTLIARLPDGRIVMGLPGNPLAAMVAAISICEPVIAGLAGRAMRTTQTVRAADAVDGKLGATTVVPFFQDRGRARLARWRGAGMLRGLAGAYGLLVVPEEGLVEGQDAESLTVPWLISR